jgi:hypothetical protein
MDTSSDCGSATVWRASQDVRITLAKGGAQKCAGQRVQQLKLLQHGLEAQLRWALANGGDQELIDLLRDQSDRLL